MSRPWIGLSALIVFLAVSFGLRTWQHWRATGSSGFRGISGAVGSPEWLGGALFAVGIALGVAGPLAEISGLPAGVIAARSELSVWLALFALVLATLGVWWSQAAMGASWRIGVSASERTELVERGPFRWVRNPIFSFMLLAALALVVLLPNALTLLSLVCLVSAVELQVRFAEEPYLCRVHGARYVDYCGRVGRFVPGIGRIFERSTKRARGV